MTKQELIGELRRLNNRYNDLENDRDYYKTECDRLSRSLYDQKERETQEEIRKHYPYLGGIYGDNDE